MNKWRTGLLLVSFSLTSFINVVLVTAEVFKHSIVEYPYCFRFTWLGEKFDKDSEIKNLTCETFRGDLKNVPCRRPLVVTANSKEPNTQLMWAKYHQKPLEIGCRLVRGESCIKYSYIYNRAVENITYMCAKVNASNGCYTQKYATGREVEVCVCESSSGASPCFTSTATDSKLHQTMERMLLYLVIFMIPFTQLRIGNIRISF